MRLANKFMHFYFDSVYNRAYDSTTARLSRYHNLQRICINKLLLDDNDRALCIGLGTGNEIFHIQEANRNVSIVGIDYSRHALKKAEEKAVQLGRDIEVLHMDAQHMEFTDGSFDKVVCIHVMDFLEHHELATKEIMRVLKDGGRFVITYPSATEGSSLLIGLLKDNYPNKGNSVKLRVQRFFKFASHLLMTLVYLPLCLRPNRRGYTNDDLSGLFTSVDCRKYQIETEPVYYDHIVYGEK